MPSLLSFRIQGSHGLVLRLRDNARQLRSLRPMFRLIGQHLTGAYQRNMTRGIDPHGRPLPRTQVWTRLVRSGLSRSASGSSGGITPLVATGALRASLGPKRITQRTLRLGFQGNYSSIAEAMVEGRRGSMIPREGVVKTSTSTGNQYVRIRTNSGQWYTKLLVGGRIPVRAQRRNFFFLARRQVAIVERAAQRYLQRITERGILTGQNP